MNDMLRPSGNGEPPARVLVAEDDRELRTLVAKLLAFDGYAVTQAANAFEMMNIMRHDDPAGNVDLIITDVRMPGLSGLDALAQLRREGYNVPVIVVSALPASAIQPQLIHVNALYLAKPYSLATLRTQVTGLINSARARAFTVPRPI